jgi:lipopolysaccharide export LptBFGC system permease protein LptF
MSRCAVSSRKRHKIYPLGYNPQREGTVRENVIIGVVIGLFFFGAGAILTALLSSRRPIPPFGILSFMAVLLC